MTVHKIYGFYKTSDGFILACFCGSIDGHNNVFLKFDPPLEIDEAELNLPPKIKNTESSYVAKALKLLFFGEEE
jgi:hypothetical protein